MHVPALQPPSIEDLGQKLTGMRSIPQFLQFGMGVLTLLVLLYLLLWTTMPFYFGIPAAGLVGFALYAITHFIPILRSVLRIYEHGLELVVQGKSTSFRYDELSSLSAQLTDHKTQHHYLFTVAKIEFLVDGRFRPINYECDFRRKTSSERILMLALGKCSDAIGRRLLEELERTGSVVWQDNVSLTDEGIAVANASGSRLIAYRDIWCWRVVDNELKIFKANDALPCLVLGNDSPNFLPLVGLFERLARATRKVDANCKSEAALVVSG